MERPIAIIAIIGAGLAGLAVAEALVLRRERRGMAPNLVVVDCGGSAASNAPGAVLNPLAGRSVAPKPGVFEAYRHAVATARRWRDELGAPVLEASMVRPLASSEAGERMARSFEEARDLFPDDFSIRRAPAADFPSIGGAAEVLTYGPAFSIDLPDTLRRLRAGLLSRGVGFVCATVEGIVREGPGWRLEGAGYGLFSAVVLAPGEGAAQWFGGLDIRSKAGELLVLQPPVGVTLDHIVGGMGHLAPMADGRWVGGSTFYRYEGEFQEPEMAEADIRRRLEFIVPAVSRASTLQVWSGVRTVLHPTRAPVVGPVPGPPGLWYLGCLGPKGLLWSPVLAGAVADALIAGASELVIPEGAASAAGLRPNPALVRAK